ncbi:hypothetical protein GCM10020331_024750 [Ectobacillus funiculus]
MKYFPQGTASPNSFLKKTGLKKSALDSFYTILSANRLKNRLYALSYFFRIKKHNFFLDISRKAIKKILDVL